MISRTRSAWVKLVFLAWTASSAASITSVAVNRSGSARSCSCWARAACAIPASPPATSARSSSSTRARNCLAGLAAVGLRGAGGHGGLPLDPVALEAGRLPPAGGFELLDQLGGPSADLVGARREHVARAGVDRGRLPGHPVGAHRHRHPEVVDQRLVGGALPDRGRGRLEPVDRPRVQRAPLPVVGALLAVEGGVVDVQLRVVVAGVVLEEATRPPSSARRPSARRHRRGARRGRSRRAPADRTGRRRCRARSRPRRSRAAGPTRRPPRPDRPRGP